MVRKPLLITHNLLANTPIDLEMLSRESYLKESNGKLKQMMKTKQVQVRNKENSLNVRRCAFHSRRLQVPNVDVN